MPTVFKTRFALSIFSFYTFIDSAKKIPA